ncbi:hypothetical protein CN264_19005 [Bacillus cereus]|uniref:diadenylate cyclase n=1 Tax=Bacillus cereus TaxID=1396 RepID=UPI000BF707B1|nr:diadenylate cyclase [Bacillus cereus]PFC23499.1 hypothetical protein CN264_19005 [Bacillus cereus]
MVKNEVESLEVENSVEEVKEFFKGLGEEISQYSGFNLKIPVSLEKDTIEYNLKGKFSLNIPQVNNRVTMEILHIVQEILGKTVQVTHSLDRNILQNIQRDVSLSLINNEYLSFGSTQQYRFWENINALKNIGTKTYEGNSVNIGVIYSLNDELTIKEIKKLKVEVKLIEKRKPIQQFFLDEKPFLRLIDNKSLVVVVNKDFEVFAIIRKKDEGKSLSNIIKSQFNDWTINEMTRITFKNLTDEFVKLLTDLKISNELKKKMSKVEKILIDYSNKIPIKENPKFIYFSLTNKKMDVYLDKEYVISYNNGDWKLKQYALMLASIMQKVFTNTLHLPFSLGVYSYNKRLLEMTTSITKLVNVIEMLSEKGGSSIFIIVLDNEQNINLTYSDAKEFLAKNNFKKNNLDRDFLNVVRNDKKHLNFTEVDKFLIETISAVDGAVVIDSHMNIVSFGEIIEIPNNVVYQETFGTGTKAARYASKLGIAIKISEDGDIYIFSEEKLLLKI